MLDFNSMPAKFTLQEQVKWLSAIVHSVNDGILVIDNEEIVRLINPEYTKITGVTAGQIIGKPLRLVRPNAQLPDALKDGKTRVGIYRKEQNTEYVVDMAPILVDNKIIGAVSICKGLTEVHKLSQELKKNKEKLNELVRTMESLYRAKYTFDHIIGNNGGLKEIVHIAHKAAESNLPVLIVGESGTGKELIAQAIHNASDRMPRHFIPVNCAAIPSELLESELFGYEEGSFTNAKKGGKIGLFELADGGTIFLDEIGDLPYNLQAKLLRVLQERTIRKVGDTREREIDVRVIAATNKDLQQLVAKNGFREDLFYRLNVITLQIPPLRERKQDIPFIIDSLLRSSAVNRLQGSYSITEQAVKAIQFYDWPGNVRELKNAIDYAICMTDNMQIGIQNLPGFIQQIEFKEAVSITQTKQTLKNYIVEAERKFIIETLSRYGNDITGKKKTAEVLGISLATLYNKLNKSNLSLTDSCPSEKP